MIITPAKKGKGLDELLKSITPGVIDDLDFSGISQDTTLIDLSDLFASLAVDYMYSAEPISGWTDYDSLDKLLKKYAPVLSPSQINAFLCLSARYEQERSYERIASHLVGTTLIQNSYNAGFNDFNLNTRTLTRTLTLGHRLRGSDNNPLRLRVYGNVKDFCLFSEQVSGYVQGSVQGEAGWYAQHSSFIIEGDGPALPPTDANACTFVFQGKGHVGNGYYVDEIRDCTFKTSNQETKDIILRHIPKGQGNALYFIEGNRTERLVRDE